MSVGPGNPDQTFDFDGRSEVRGELANPGRVVSMLKRSDGFTYVLTELPGVRGLPGASDSPSDGVAVTRLMSDGSVDLSWGQQNNGRFVFNVGLGVDGAVLLDAGTGNGLYIAGTAFAPRLGSGGFDPAGDFLLARVTEAGALDFNYRNGAGYQRLDLDGLNSSDFLTSAGVDGAGNVTLYGQYALADGGGASEAFVRLNAAGDVVGGFGDVNFPLAAGGFRRPYFGAFSLNPGNLAVATDGSFHVSRTPLTAPGVELTRFTAGGLVDSAFIQPSLVGVPAVARGLVLDEASGGLFVGLGVGSNLRVFMVGASVGAVNLSYGGSGSFSLSGSFVGTADETRLALLPGGRLAVAYRGTANSAPVSAVFSLTAGGLLDLGFGAGVRTFSSSTGAGALALGSTAAGELVAGVGVLASPFFTLESASDMLGLLSSGSLSFSTPLSPFFGGYPSEVSAVAVDSGGRSLSVFTTPFASGGSHSIGVELTGRDGVRVSSRILAAGRFGGDIEVGGVFSRPDGKSVVFFSTLDTLSGSTSATVIVGVLNSDGSSDLGFFGSGFRSIAPSGDIFYKVTSAIELSGGGYLIAGLTSIGRRMLIRLDANLEVATGFGSGGIVSTGGPGTSAYESVAEDDLGRIYAVGWRNPNTRDRVIVERFFGDGALDTSWGTSGMLEPYADARALSAALVSSEGRLYVGTSSFANPIADRRPDVLAINLVSQALDPAFGTGGVSTLGTLSGFSSGVRGLAADPAGGLIAVGDRNNKPLITRVLSNGTVDPNYALAFGAPFDQFGRFNRVVMDAAGRPVVGGIVGATGGAGPRVGEVRRFQATTPVAGRVLLVDAKPRPRVGDTFGVITLRFQAPVGLRLQADSFTGAVEFQGPNSTGGLCAVGSIRFLDDGRTADVEYRYSPGSPFTASSTGSYAFSLVVESILDDGGNRFPPTSLPLAQLQLNFTGTPQPGDVDESLNVGQGFVFYSSDLSLGELVQIVERTDGTTYLLSNLPPIADLPSRGFYGGVAITKRLASGALDTSFGVDGHYTFSLFAGVTGVQLMDLGVGNGFMVAGDVTRANELTGAMQRDLLLVKLGDNGVTSASFGAGRGFRIYDPTGASENAGGAVALSGGGFILQSTHLDSFATRTVILGVDAAGDPLQSFGEPDFIISPGAFAMPTTHDFTPSVASRSIVQDDGGLIYVVGADRVNERVAVFSFNAAGQINRTFSAAPATLGVAQFVITTTGGPVNARGSAIVVAPSGSLAVGFVTSTQDAGVLKLDSTGLPNSSFGGGDGVVLFNDDGVLTTQTYGVDIDLDAFSNDSLAVAVTASAPGGRVVSLVLAADGSVDTSYGVNGSVNIGLAPVNPARPTSGAHVLISTSSPGSILVGGSRDQSNLGNLAGALITRLDLNGAVVPGFTDGTSGPGRVSLGAMPDASIGSARAVFLNPDGSAFTVYTTIDPLGGETIGSRVLGADGSGRSGSLAGGGQFTNYSFAGVARQPGGNYVAVFSARDANRSNARVIVFAFFDAAGIIISNIGQSGFISSQPSGSQFSYSVTSMVRLANGNLLLGGSRGSTGALFVYDLNGIVVTPPVLSSVTDSRIEAIALDPNTGSVFLAYTQFSNTTVRFGPNGGLPFSNAGVEKRLADLTLDTSFGTQGTVQYLPPNNSVFRTFARSLLFDVSANRLLLGGGYFLDSLSFEAPAGYFLHAFRGDSGANAIGFAPVVSPPRGFLAGIDGLARDTNGSYIAVGSENGAPLIARFGADGIPDVDYAGNFNPSRFHYGRYRGVILDATGRPIVFGEEGRSQGAPRPGVVRRFIASTAVVSPPGATLVGTPNTPLFGSPFVALTVEYTAAPGRTINQASIAGNNLVLTLNGSPVGTAQVASVDPVSPNVVRVTYRLITPATVYDFSNNGFYEVSISPSTAVRDDNGTAAPSGQIHTFTTNFQPVTASLATPPVPRVGDTSVTFTVTYSPSSGRTLDPGTISPANIVVFDPGLNPLAVTLLSTATSGGSVTVTYSFAAPGGAFSIASVGTYQLNVGPSPVRDDAGSPTGVSGLGNLVVQYIRPSAALGGSAQPNFGAASGTVSIIFSPGTGRSLILSSVDGGEIRITRPDGSIFTATLLTTTPSAPAVNGALPPDATITAVYSLTPVGTTFAFIDAGQYTLEVIAGTVVDSQNSPLLGGSLGAVSISFPRPTATAAAPPSPALGATFAEFTITYTPAPGVVLAVTSLGDDDVRVLLPGGSTVAATLVSTSLQSDGSVLGVYRFSPTGGVFDTSAGGTYVATTVDGAVTDARGVPIAASRLFSLTVALPGVPGNLVSVTVPAGPYLPGDVINPTVVVANPIGNLPSQPFTLRFFIRVGETSLDFGDISVSPLAPGATRTILFDGRLSLPSSTQLLPGTYVIGARVIASDGASSGASLTSPVRVVVTSPPQPTPGTLDPTFGGGDGIVTTFVPGPTITLVGSIAQTGSRLVSGGFNSNGDFVLLRFNGDGSPDTTFGVNGQVTLDVSGGQDIATTITSDPLGRIVLGGTSRVGETSQFSVVRFNPDGTLDPTFSPSSPRPGILLFTPPNSQASLLRGISTDRFGRPYILGSILAAQTQGGPALPQGVVIRLTPGGVVDGSFGSLGVISAAFTAGRPGVLPFRDGQSELASLLLLPDRIVVGGFSANSASTASRFILAGLSYNGRLDTRFGNRGVFNSQLGSTLDRVTTLLANPNGTIYAAGSRGNGASTTAVLFRVTPAGAIDRGFNRGQVLPLNTNTTFGTASSLLDSVNNTVLITVATAASLSDAANGLIGSVVFRITPAGANDTFFNNGSPQIIFDVSGLRPATTRPLAGDFDSFVQSKQGATQRVEGGRVRSLSATPVTEGTSVSIAQLSQDGVDLLPTLSGNIPATVRPGFRGTATLTVSNIGSLIANGRFSVTLIAAGGTTVTLPATVLSSRIPQGGTRTFRIRFSLPTTTPEGTYQLQATLGRVPSSFADINTANDRATRPGDFAISPTGARAASAVLIASSPSTPANTKLSATRVLFSDQPLL